MLRSYAVTHFTALVDLSAASITVNEYYQLSIERFTALASATTINLIIRCIRGVFGRRISLESKSMEDYWPNLRTLSICNAIITCMRFREGKICYEMQSITGMELKKNPLPEVRVCVGDGHLMVGGGTGQV